MVLKRKDEAVKNSDMEETVEKNVTKAEEELIVSQQIAQEEAGASTEKMKRATALLSSKFNLDSSYHVTNFKDAGKVVDTTLENNDFIVTIRVKDSERQGLVVED